MTHIEILDLDTLPSHLIVIGGGYTGVEFAQAYRRFGAEVTVIQRQVQILPKEDTNVAACRAGVLEREEIHFLTNNIVESVSGLSGQRVTLKLKSTNGEALAETSISGSHSMLVLAGYPIPKTDLEKVGINITASGHVAVDEQPRTAVSGVYAAGDVAGSPYSTHMGFDDYRIVSGDITGSPRPRGYSGMTGSNSVVHHTGAWHKSD